MKDFRVVIAGGRHFSDRELMAERLGIILSRVIKEYNLIVVSGTASGADQLGEDWAETLGITVERYPADWDGLGKRAGYVRNEQMAKVADAVVLFWDGTSRGTRHMKNIAESLGKRVVVVDY